jgi:hypothetical protein
MTILASRNAVGHLAGASQKDLMRCPSLDP